jgi:hypothetical protein
MIKFLLCLPLAIFIGAEIFIVYKMGDIIYAAANETATVGLMGEWGFWHIVLSMVGIMVGIIFATFLYVNIVLKPAFYPSLEAERISRMTQKNNQAYSSASAAGYHGHNSYNQYNHYDSYHHDEPKKKHKLLIIILIIVGVLIIGLVALGIIFRSAIFDFVGSRFGGIFGSQPADEENGAEAGNDNYDIGEPGTSEELSVTESESVESVQTPEPEIITNQSFIDVQYNWTLFYPPGLQHVMSPIDDGLNRVPSDLEPRLLYWSEEKAGFNNASEFMAADPTGILGVANISRMLDSDSLICRFDGTDTEGNPFYGVRYWYIDPDGTGMASAEIASETPEEADRWYSMLDEGQVYIRKNEPQPAQE